MISIIQEEKTSKIAKHIQLRRLTALLDVAKAINPKEFNMAHWWITNCKTVGCLAGHYIRCKKPKGLKLVPCMSFPSSGEMVFRIKFDGQSTEFDLLGEHFGIDKTQTYNLFSSSTYKRDLGAEAKREAIKRVKQTIKEIKENDVDRRSLTIS